ncbi:MAG TPA: Smr/MutS family protein [Sphingomicrobium sp.]|nr:Smr/MutS family protein [Sphingomicrobium sp.]
MRSLSTEEAELWARVAATIRPLSRQPVASHTNESLNPAGEKPVLTRKVVERAPTKPVARVPIRERTLDGTWDKKLRSGAVEPDRVLDLHGMNLDGAYAAIDCTLDEAIARGERVLLLITGHHRQGEPPIQRGRIRAAVHDWLAASRHSSEIAAVREAHRRHGGGGSLYLVLRRKGSRPVTIS